MPKRKIDAEQLVLRILGFDEDLLRDDYPKALVEAELRGAGADPDEIGREGEAFVKKLMAERAEAESRKASRTRLRSQGSASAAPADATTAALSTVPPMRVKTPSESGSLGDPD